MVSALTSGDLDNLRRAYGTHATKVYLSVVEPTTVGTAQVNQTTFTNDITELTIDTLSAGFTTDVQKGMTVWVGTTAGARDVGTYRVRKTPTSSTLYISAIADGDPGLLALASHQALADDLHITVVQDFNISTVYSRIQFSSGAVSFFKDYDIAYTDQTTTAGTPVVLNLGAHVADFVDGSTLEVSMTATIDALNSGVTVSSYSWDIDDGTFTVGGTTTQSWTGTFPVGQRYVSCTVTLSNGTTVTGRRVVIAHDTGDSAPIPVRVESDQRVIRGRRVVLELAAESLAGTDLPDGTMCILWEQPTWPDGAIDSAIQQFVGFTLRADTSNPGGGQGRVVNVELASALLVLRETGFVSQVLIVPDGTPDNWTEVELTLAHTEYMLFYLMYWHSDLLALFDWTRLGDFDAYLASAYGTSSQNIPDALDETARRLNCVVGQGSDGTLYTRRDPVLMNSTQRTALSERMTITEADVASGSVTRFIRNQANRVRGYGKYFGGGESAYQAYAPGITRGQGGGFDELNGQLVLTQDELNQRTGDYFAKLNSPIQQIRLEFVGNYDVFEVAASQWARVDVPAEYWTEGDAYNGRVVPIEASARYLEGGQKLTALTCVPETDGVDADSYIPPVPPSNQIPDYTVDFPTYISAPPSTSLENVVFTNLGDTQDNIILYLNDGTVATTTDFTTPAASGGPTWTGPTSVSGLGASFAYSQDNSATAGDACWYATSDGIYYATGLTGGSPSATQQHAWSEAMAAAAIDASFTFDNGQFVLCVARPVTGSNSIQLARTTDGGSTWTIDSLDRSSNWEPGVVVDMHNAGVGYFHYQPGITATFLHKATSYGAVLEGFSDLECGSGGGANVYIPLGQDTVRYIFYGFNGAGSTRALVRADLQAEVDVQLNPSGGLYTSSGPDASLGLHKNCVSAPNSNKNRLYVVAQAGGKTGAEAITFSTSTNALGGSPTFTVLHDSTSNGSNDDGWRGCQAVDDDPALCYVFGGDGTSAAVGLYDESAGAIDDRLGNLVSSATVLGLAGF